ncbi:flavin reductase (DIM6/NTAB) family NADH-FMN oxidoreductase RutF [Lacinutrix venerupis]|uniref:flavin reductase family protein n=1 Tax=Lacinutrix venerupis TaxID=1486034 RepID=UPI000EB0F2EA|nr:flavin reductase [Lacinutrix venerupis]RLJ68982.1 flavin reductase (DIM6/NTAB) family NADH-FMN oxidoreductase RutF [Lacinutrix venerupis]
MTYFSLKDINNLEHLYKINLINSCSGYKSANLIGTKSSSGIENVAIFSSITHVGSSPPILGFFCRPTTVTRNTYDNIKNTGVYTINHIHKSNFKDAHHTSAKYNSSISEFDKTSLKAEYKANFHAPFVKHSPVQIAMKFINEYPIKENGTILILGEIQGLYINNSLITEDGFVNLSKANIATINSLDGYAFPKLEERLAYQRPK